MGKFLKFACAQNNVCVKKTLKGNEGPGAKPPGKKNRVSKKFICGLVGNFLPGAQRAKREPEKKNVVP